MVTTISGNHYLWSLAAMTTLPFPKYTITYIQTFKERKKHICVWKILGTASYLWNDSRYIFKSGVQTEYQ